MADVLTYVKHYIGRGWCPVPLKRGTKQPAIDGWPDFVCDDRAVKKFWGGHTPCGVGLPLGRSGLIDIELDDEHARCAAAIPLPRTAMVFGHDWRYTLLVQVSEQRQT